MITDGYNFYDGVYDYLEEVTGTFDEREIQEYVEELPDDYEVIFNETKVEPIFELTADWIIDRVDEERWTEDGAEISKVERLLDKYINFDAINQEMPRLYYEDRLNEITYTKEDLENEVR